MTPTASGDESESIAVSVIRSVETKLVPGKARGLFDGLIEAMRAAEIRIPQTEHRDDGIEHYHFNMTWDTGRSLSVSVDQYDMAPDEEAHIRCSVCDAIRELHDHPDSSGD